MSLSTSSRGTQKEPVDIIALAPAKIIRMFQHAAFVCRDAMFNHRIDQYYLYKVLRPVGQENPSTVQCKAVTGRQKAGKGHMAAHKCLL